jgi:hypothetical protein
MNGDARPSARSKLAEVVQSSDAVDQATQWLVDNGGDHDTVLLKDPRMAWFVDVWTDVAEMTGRRVAIVRMVRDPVAVVSSTLRWYEQTRRPEYRLGGWITANHNVDAQRGANPVVNLDHGGLLSEPDAVMANAVATLHREGLGLGLDATVTGTSGFIDPSRPVSQRSDLVGVLDDSSQLLAIAEQIHGLLRAEMDGDVSTAAALDQRMELYANYADLYGRAEHLVYESQPTVIDAASRRLADRDAALTTTRAAVADLEHKLDEATGRIARLNQTVAAREATLAEQRRRITELEQSALGYRLKHAPRKARQRMLGWFKQVAPGLYGSLRSAYRSGRSWWAGRGGGA